MRSLTPHLIFCTHILKNPVISNNGDSNEASRGRDRVSHFFGGQISTLVLIFCKLLLGALQPDSNPWLRGWQNIEQKYYRDHGENY
jgi:hypothetical protein